MPPDWVIEILSPEQSQTKVTGKILHCLKYGSKLGWLVDPVEKSVLVYPPGQQPELLEQTFQRMFYLFRFNESMSTNSGKSVWMVGN